MESSGLIESGDPSHRRIWSQYAGEHARVVDAIVQPEVLDFSRQDDGHPIMDRTEKVVGCSCDDGTGRNDGSFGVFLRFPESCECEWFSRPHDDPHRRLRLSVPPPLVEPISQQQASSPTQGISEGGFLRVRHHVTLLGTHNRQSHSYREVSSPPG